MKLFVQSGRDYEVSVCTHSNDGSARVRASVGGVVHTFAIDRIEVVRD